MRSDPVLTELFRLIVESGNYLNAGNVERERADGFVLDILSNIQNVKSVVQQFGKGHGMVKYLKGQGIRN